MAAFGLGAGLNLLGLVFAVLARPPAARAGWPAGTPDPAGSPVDLEGRFPLLTARDTVLSCGG